MAGNMQSPIFIHSLWRSSSTYLFNVFRRSSNGYWCYQEPIHEAVLLHRDHPDALLQFQGEVMLPLRHPVLDRPYYQEIHEIAPLWKDLIRKTFIYDEYFRPDCGQELKDYLLALIDGAQGRPVIQECRTANRIKAIKQALGGVHIYLWRNPWDQWWSFKSTSYFDVAVQLVLNARPHPSVIDQLTHEIGFVEFHDDDFIREFEFFDVRRLSAEDSYLAFFILWCLAWIEGNDHADIRLNIDRLTESTPDRLRSLSELEQLGVTGLNLADCRVHRITFTKKDQSFFLKIEDRAYGLLLAHGVALDIIDDLRKSRRKHEPVQQHSLPDDGSGNEVLEDAMRTREVVLRNESIYSHQLRQLHFLHASYEHEVEGRLHLLESDLSQTQKLNREHIEHEEELAQNLAILREESARAQAEQVELFEREKQEALDEMRRQHNAEKNRLDAELLEIHAALEAASQVGDARQRELTDRERIHGQKIEALYLSWRQAEAERDSHHKRELTEMEAGFTELLSSFQDTLWWRLGSLFRLLPQLNPLSVSAKQAKPASSNK